MSSAPVITLRRCSDNLIPIRCKCGYPLADMYTEYCKTLKTMQGSSTVYASTQDELYPQTDTIVKQVLERFQITRACCRMHLMTQPN